MTELPGIPELRWLGSAGDATADGKGLVLRAGPATDWFADPSGAAPIRSAPVLAGDVDGDCQVTARVTVAFGAVFDAGVLFLHRDDDTYAKLCFEQSPEGEATVVSVVTRQSPTGAGCTARFEEIGWTATTLADPRDGS